MTKRRPSVDISEVTFYPIKPTDKGLVCYVSFTYNDALRINDVGIYTRLSGGYRLLYPIKVLANGKTVSSIYPINKTIGYEIEDFLLSQYEQLTQKTKNGILLVEEGKVK